MCCLCAEPYSGLAAVESVLYRLLSSVKDSENGICIVAPSATQGTRKDATDCWTPPIE